MAITGISSYDGKQIIAAGAQSAISAGIASNLEYKDGYGTVITTYPGDGQYYSGGFIVGSIEGDKGISVSPNAVGFYNSTGDVAQITSGKIAKWDSLSADKQDKLTFGYTDNQISQINGSAIYSQGGGGGVVTATGGTTAYVQTINGKNISATNAGSALSATSAYNLTNTAIKVASATSASTAYTLGNTAIKVASATSANYALAAPQTQSDWSVTATGNVAYIKNKPSIWTPTVYHYDNATTLTAGSGQQIGSEGIYVKFNPGNFLTSYTINSCRMIAERMTDTIWDVLLSIRLTDVIGTQWTQKSNAIVVNGGHMANGPVLFNCYSTWAGTPWCQFGMDLNWETAMYCINREIRNSSTADNNSLFINVEMEIHKA